MAILATVALPCLPVGVVAVIYSIQVNQKMAAGNLAGALRASNTSKIWSWITLGIAAVVWFFFILGFLANLTQTHRY